MSFSRNKKNTVSHSYSVDPSVKQASAVYLNSSNTSKSSSNYVAPTVAPMVQNQNTASPVPIVQGGSVGSKSNGVNSLNLPQSKNPNGALSALKNLSCAACDANTPSSGSDSYQTQQQVNIPQSSMYGDPLLGSAFSQPTGLQFGINADQPHLPTAVIGGVNPSVSVMGTDYSTLVTNAEPWYTGKFLSQPAAVLHDNNPLNRSTTVLHRALDGSPVVTTIIPDLNGFPIVRSITPTKNHLLGCPCAECTQYKLDDICIDNLNAVDQPINFTDYTGVQITYTNLLDPYTFIITIVPSSRGHPLADRIPTGIALAVNGTPGRTIFVRRGCTYYFKFTMDNQFVVQYPTSSPQYALALKSKLIFVSDPVGGPNDFPGTAYGTGIPVDSLATYSTATQSGFPQNGLALDKITNSSGVKVTVGAEMSNSISKEFIVYYQLNNTAFAGGPIIVLPDNCVGGAGDAAYYDWSFRN